MASIQEQLRHIRTANDDWYDEHRRYFAPNRLILTRKCLTNDGRLIGELTQLSRRTTPDRRSQVSTPQLDDSH
jgi:hypothetical protein